MGIKALFSEKSTASDVTADIKKQLDGFEVNMMVYFASSESFEHNEISAAMQSAFPNSVVFGCTSHAELYGGKTRYNTVTAMVFNSEAVTDVKVELLENISAGIDVKPVFESFDSYFKTPMAAADYKEYGGIILVDGLSMKEEEIMDKIGTQSNIIFIGGSASDAFKFNKTYVFANGKAYTDAALLVVFKTKNGVDFIKTQSVDVKNIDLTITKAIPEKRAVVEFDNKPAAIRYAEALEVDRSEIDSKFFANPVGLIIDDDVYIRNCQRTDGDAMIFYCGMEEGMDLKLCKIRNIIPDTKAAVENKVKELNSIAGIIDFRCAFRTVQMGNEGTIEEYTNIFSGIPAIGFSTYGEEFHGHMNQTSTMIVFK
ncbi:MAG: FIST C-terminal domain-containing protein [Chitinispirillales bacterium]|nr:FIST C-terminal domain-containing protein [Chitinispirillales bacterium]